MIDLIYAPLNILDGWISNWIPDLVRICIWGALSGSAAMLLYYRTSNQEAISAQKDEIRSLRSRMLKDDLAYSDMMRLAKKNLSASLRFFASVLTPSLVASIPVLLIVVWIGVHQSYALPPDGSPVNVTIDPRPTGLRFSPDDQFVSGAEEIQFYPTPGNGPVTIEDGAGMVYQGRPLDPPVPIVYKRQWWNTVLGNPAGYIAPTSNIKEIRWAFPRKLFVSALPIWAATWELPFFLSVFVTAIVLKFAMRIE